MKRFCFGLAIFLIVFLSESNSDVTQGSKFQFNAARPQYPFRSAAFGYPWSLNCSTNDASATATLWKRNLVCGGLKHCRWFKKKPDAKIVKAGNTFTILKVGIRDAGRYRCQAVNSKGKKITWPNKNGLLLVTYLPKAPNVSITPKYEVSLKVGQNITFTCRSASHAQLEWFKETSGRKYKAVQAVRSHKTAKQRNLIMTITNAQKGDAGYYKCVMKFRRMTRVKFASLRVFDTPLPNIVSHSGKNGPVIVNKNRNEVDIECTAEGLPKPTTILWYKDGKQITNSIKHKLLFSSFTNIKVKGFLKIKQFKEKDLGLYTCTAVNKHGRYSADIQVKRPAPFQFLAPKPSSPLRSVPFGNNLSISCSTNDPSANTKLLKKICRGHVGCGWKNLPSKKLVKTGNTFTILNVGIRDAGHYKCQAVNSKGKKIEWPNKNGLLVMGIPFKSPSLSVIPINSVSLKVGQNTKFICRSEGNTQLQWFKKISGQNYKSVVYHKNARKNNKNSGPTELILTITNAQIADSGVYKCVMKYQGRTRVKFASLRVGSPPKPKSSGGSSTTVLTVSAPAGVMMRCSMTGFPLPSITWYKDGVLINCTKGVQSCGSNSQLSIQEKKKTKSQQTFIRSKLKFASTNSRDQGVYTCKAQNQFGVTRQTYKLSVN